MAWLVCFGALALGCAEAASSDPGVRARLHVEQGQFVEGALPDESGGTEIVSTRLAHDRIAPGARSESFSGALASDATSVVMGLEGDVGHWVVRAGAASLIEPELPTFTATLSFARALRAGKLTLRAAAVDARGRVGPYLSQTLTVTADAGGAALLVRLRWDNDADLDLHLVTPEGEEIFAGNVNAQVAPPPGQSARDPTAFRDAGQLSLDSNANCRGDGRREESIVFPGSPGAGIYVVKVATPSLCGESVAHYHVEAFLEGARVGAADGTSLPQDTRFGAGRGAGARAFSFPVP
jgi:hypothetical protein